MSHSVRCLVYKHEDLGSGPQHTHKSQEWLCTPVTLVLGSHWSLLATLVSQ